MKKEKYIVERRRKSGIAFEVSVPYYDRNGDRVMFSRSFAVSAYSRPLDAMKAAIACRDAFLTENRLNGAPVRSDKTVVDVFEMSLAIRNLRPETERQHRITFSSCVPEELRTLPIAKLKTIDVKACLASVAKERTDNAVKRCLTMWRQICETALDAELISKDILRGVTAPESAQISTKREKSMTCSLEEICAAIASHSYFCAETRFNGEIMIAALGLCAALGLRPAEVFALKKDDADLRKKTIRVGYRVGSAADGSGEIIRPKTATSLRTLPLTASAADLIRDLSKKQPSPFLFAKYDGSLWTSRARSDYMRRICRLSGLQFNLYQLRHQFSTDLITAGVDLRTVQELMGHASGSMSLEYARSNDKLKREALELLTDKVSEA